MAKRCIVSAPLVIPIESNYKTFNKMLTKKDFVFCCKINPQQQVFNGPEGSDIYNLIALHESVLIEYKVLNTFSDPCWEPKTSKKRKEFFFFCSTILKRVPVHIIAYRT